MTILNIGSINIDTVYHVSAIPRPGETIAATRVTSGLGGKGLNQSVAIARSGAKVKHCGMVGANDRAVVDYMASLGIDVAHIGYSAQAATGQAVVMLSDDGENSILLFGGANRTLEEGAVARAIDTMAPGEWVVFQNETNGLAWLASHARRRGLELAFAAAPFQAEAVVPLLPEIDLLAVNEVEYRQLCAATGGESWLRPDLALLMTRGGEGAEFRLGVEKIVVPAFAADVVDTTGAGDTFLGYFLSTLAQGKPPRDALRTASAAAAIQVSRWGAAEVIPTGAEVSQFLKTPRIQDEGS